MYILHIGNKNYSSWSLRPWVLMKTLGIPFEEVLHAFPPDRPLLSRVQAVLAAWPRAGARGRRLEGWESLGIVEYLADRHPGIWPEDQHARDWARSAAAEMHGGFSHLRYVCGMNVGIRVRLGTISDGLRRDLNRLEDLWKDGLLRFGGPFLAGEKFTASTRSSPRSPSASRPTNPPVEERARAYAARLLGLPAMQEWTAAALAEDFREPNHEAEARAAGEWTEDFRAPAKS